MGQHGSTLHLGTGFSTGSRVIITKPLALLLFLAGVYCLYTGMLLVLHNGF